jgi:hypothetical protein
VKSAVVSFISLVLLASIFLSAQQTPAPPSTGLILGQVVDAGGGPVSGAVVTISGTGPTPIGPAPASPAGPVPPTRATRSALTNADGRFLLPACPALLMGSPRRRPDT